MDDEEIMDLIEKLDKKHDLKKDTLYEYRVVFIVGSNHLVQTTKEG